MSKKPEKKIIKFNFNISWIYILLLIGIGWMFFNQSSANPQKEEWADVKKQWLAGDIKEVVFIRNEYEGRVTDLTVLPDMRSSSARRFRRNPRISYFSFLRASMPKKCLGNLMPSCLKTSRSRW